MKTINGKNKTKVFSFQGKVFLKVICMLIALSVIACKKESVSPVIDEQFPTDGVNSIIKMYADDTFSNRTTGLKEMALLDIDGDRVADFDVIISNTAESSTYSILIMGSGENQVADSSNNLINPLKLGRKINSSLTTWSKSGYVAKVANGEIEGLMSDDDAFVGIKFVKAGKVYFGWIKIKIPLHRGMEHSIVLQTYGVQQQESVAVKAGYALEFL